MIDHFTESWQAQGSGRLTLKLDLPLPAAARDQTQVAGAYQFTGNTLLADPDLPPIEQASGRIEFTQNTVRAQGITGTSPAVRSPSPPPRSVIPAYSLRSRAHQHRKHPPHGIQQFLQHVRGATDWRANYTAYARGRCRNRIQPAGSCRRSAGPR